MAYGILYTQCLCQASVQNATPCKSDCNNTAFILDIDHHINTSWSWNCFFTACTSLEMGSSMDAVSLAANNQARTGSSSFW